MSCWALIPVKARRVGKQRLARAVSGERRAELIGEMFERVLEAVRACPAVDTVAVVTPEPALLPAGVHVLQDRGRGVNEVVDAAVRQIEARGASRVAVLPADTPNLSAADVSALIAASEPGGLAIAPDHHDLGTNAVCLSLPTAFRFQYGPGSLARHLAQAVRLGLDAKVVRLPGLCFDVDEPEDLELLTSPAKP
jgi:2-phospho-L-lactate guanylyltransferase